MKKEITTIDGPFQIVFRAIQNAFVYLVDFGRIEDGQFRPSNSIPDFLKEIDALSLPCLEVFREEPLFTSSAFIEYSDFSEVLLNLAKCRSFSSYAFHSGFFVVSFNPSYDEPKKENEE